MSAAEPIDARTRFGWLAPLSDDEVAAVVFSHPGEMLDDGDWYVDATSPKRGPVLSLGVSGFPKAASTCAARR